MAKIVPGAELFPQEEIDQFFRAINSGDTEPLDVRLAKSRWLKIYDFKRPDKFSKNHIRAISTIHDHFSELLQTSLSALLRCDFHLTVASVDPLTYEEFVRSIPTPTTLGLVEMSPLKGNIVIEIDPRISSCMIDRLLGGSGESTKSQHKLSKNEKAFMQETITGMLGSLKESWTRVTDLCPKLIRLDTDPQLVQLVPSWDMVLLVTLEAKIHNTEGIISLCIPHNTVATIMEKVSTVYFPESKPRITKGYQLRSRKDALVELTTEGVGNMDKFNETTNVLRSANMKMNITVELGTTALSVKEVFRLGEGSILELDNTPSEALHIKANGVLIAKGETVVVENGNFGMRICEIIDEQKLSGE